VKSREDLSHPFFAQKFSEKLAIYDALLYNGRSAGENRVFSVCRQEFPLLRKSKEKRE
jgi:hypothetical protein